MTQGRYISENAESLIRRSQQTLGDISPVQELNIIDIQVPVYIEEVKTEVPTIQSLSPSCNRVEVKNIVTVIDSGIIICSGLSTTTCTAGIPASCPVNGVSPNDYVNMVARVYAQAPETELQIVFDYLENDVPMTTPHISFNITTGGIGGAVYVYAFTTNKQYTSGQSLTLHGVRQV